MGWVGSFLIFIIKLKLHLRVHCQCDLKTRCPWMARSPLLHFCEVAVGETPVRRVGGCKEKLQARSCPSVHQYLYYSPLISHSNKDVFLIKFKWFIFLNNILWLICISVSHFPLGVFLPTYWSFFKDSNWPHWVQPWHTDHGHNNLERSFRHYLLYLLKK